MWTTGDVWVLVKGNREPLKVFQLGGEGRSLCFKIHVTAAWRMGFIEGQQGSRGAGGGGLDEDGAVLCTRTFCGDGNVLYLRCLLQKLLALCGS